MAGKRGKKVSIMIPKEGMTAPRKGGRGDGRPLGSPLHGEALSGRGKKEGVIKIRARKRRGVH